MTSASIASAGPVEYRIVRFDVEFSTKDSEPTTQPDERIPDPVLGLGIRDRYASAAFGLNEDGVVVGMANVDLPGGIPPFDVVSRPFVWQPEPIHGAFGVDTMHPLEWWATVDCEAAIGDCEPFAHGAAFDVNADGDVVGVGMRCHDGSPTPYRAFVWSPDTGLGHCASTMNQLDPFLPTDGNSSAGAASISDRTNGIGGPVTATAVGWQLDAATALEAPYAFDARSLTQTPLPVIGPSGPDFYEKGRASGIRPDPAAAAWIAGALTENSVRGTFCAEEADLLPIRWDGTVLEQLPFTNPSSPPTTINGVARDVNDAGFVVGYVGDQDTTSCIQRAAYWPTPAQLELFAPNPADASDSTVAIATNASGATVGMNLDAQTAIRWAIPSQYVDLNDVTDCVNCDLLALESAHDINDDGWIVGVARAPDHDAVTQVGVLLVPLGPCPADVDRDGDVDATDLALVQTATGACPPRTICWRDVNGDCHVDAADVQIVLQYLKTQACATNETLAAPLAAIWMASGGEQFLESDPDAAAVVESAYDPESQVTTFVNLLEVIE